MSRQTNPKRKELMNDCIRFDLVHILNELKDRLPQKKPKIHHLARVVYSDYLLITKCDSKWMCHCLTCSSILPRHNQYMHPWHFRTAWSSLKYKFVDDNVRPQCYSCNVWKNGNYQVYTLHMIDKFWRERVDNILSDQEMITIKNREYAEKILTWYNILQERKTSLELKNTTTVSTFYTL